MRNGLTCLVQLKYTIKVFFMKFVVILRNVNSVLLQFDVILTNLVLTSPHQINPYIWRRKSNFT